jgi:hypothetical protein
MSAAGTHVRVGAALRRRRRRRRLLLLHHHHPHTHTLLAHMLGEHTKPYAPHKKPDAAHKKADARRGSTCADRWRIWAPHPKHPARLCETQPAAAHMACVHQESRRRVQRQLLVTI